ncbi:MAG TPA: cysteine--tRNA ligase [Polyangiaceae bacterium]
MSLLPRLYNTLTRTTEELSVKEPGKVGIYCCGPTVYDVPHAGHARAALVPDLLVRRLRDKGLAVTYVRNLTDVDDKILARAQQNGEPPLDLSRRMSEVYQQQMRAIGCLDPDREPRVSEHIPQIFDLIAQLIERGAAYVVDMPGGTRDVYFAVRNFDGYGKLSRRNIEELRVGARIEKDENKHDPLDFALWKGATSDAWGWASPWGYGRPGWHIECSAMSGAYLGHGFDVHVGGMDLIFPHHENEIAQSEAAHPDAGPFARCWMHNGFVNVDKEKMSKSLGNFVTVRDVLERNDAEAFRYFLLSVHYRGPIQFETEQSDGRVIFPGVDEAERRMDYLYGTRARLTELAAGAGAAGGRVAPDLEAKRAAIKKAVEQAEAALDDDLNSVVALAALGEIATQSNELCDLATKRRKDAALVSGSVGVARDALQSLDALCRALGLMTASAAEYATRTRERRLRLRGLSAAEIEAKVQLRDKARKDKDFALADRARDELLALRIALRDAPDGTLWSIEQ